MKIRADRSIVMKQSYQRYQLKTQIFDMIQEIEYLSIVPDPSVEADASIIFVEDVMLNCLLVVVVRHQGGVIAWHSDAGVA